MTARHRPRARVALAILGVLVAGALAIGWWSSGTTAPPLSTIPSTTASGQPAGTSTPLPVGAEGPASAWRLLFRDEFSGPTVDRSRWGTCHWWAPDGCTIASNWESEWYLPGQVSQRNGVLSLEAERMATVGDGKRLPWRSGMITSGRPSGLAGAVPRFAFRYGFVEWRVRLPRGVGFWPALWLLPATNQSVPEVDILEAKGGHPTELHLYLHPDDNMAHLVSKLVTGAPDLTAGWHTVALEWLPGRLRWLLDGREQFRVDGDRVPAEPMYLIANLAVGSWAGQPDATTPSPARFDLDYVRVWQR